MQQSVIRFLLLTSLCACVILGKAQLLSVSGDETNRYAANLSFNKASVSGIFLIKSLEDEQIVGTLVNEFGIKAFDFTYNVKKDKMKLQNVIGMLDKWYIKRIVCADLSCLLRRTNTADHLRKRKAYVDEMNEIVLENEKYHIIYKFQAIHDITE